MDGKPDVSCELVPVADGWADGGHAERGDGRLDFEANLARFRAKLALIPPEYHEALGWLYVYRQIQDQRKRLFNRSIQMQEGKRTFWGSVLPVTVLGPMAALIRASADKIEDSEALAARRIDALLRDTSWYREVAVPAAKGVGMGTLTAAKILWAYGSASRFATFGRIVRYSRLAPENGEAPKRRHGAKIRYNPAAWQALFDLSESWNRKPDCVWRQRWDLWKAYYADKYSAYPKGRIHHMGRRKVLREFLRDLYEFWGEWERQRGWPGAEGRMAVSAYGMPPA